MDNKVESQQVVEIIKEHKVRPNKDLILAMEFIKKYFDINQLKSCVSNKLSCDKIFNKNGVNYIINKESINW
jgi:hypothetical protein